MTHIAWVPEEWREQARNALAGMAERHPSRTIILEPKPDSGKNRIDATVTLESYTVPGSERSICSEIISLELQGTRAKAPASIVEPLLISDLPVFIRWRGEPPWGSPELDQLVRVVDRLIVDSTEWDDLPYPYRRLVEIFERTAVSDIAWSRTARWRTLLASLWPGIADVSSIRVHGTQAQAYLLAGWLRRGSGARRSRSRSTSASSSRASTSMAFRNLADVARDLFEAYRFLGRNHVACVQTAGFVTSRRDLQDGVAHDAYRSDPSRRVLIDRGAGLDGKHDLDPGWIFGGGSYGGNLADFDTAKQAGAPGARPPA